ncbi:MAG: phage/plasmid primase, P4 family, partial [Gemmataceae bacterium]
MTAVPCLQCQSSQFDTHKNLLNVANGVINLQTGQLLPHDPSLMLTQLTEIPFCPNARCPLWQKTVRDILVNEEIVEFAQTMFGYFATGETNWTIVPIMTGDGGNGKSLLVGVIRDILGDDLISDIAEELVLEKAQQPHPEVYYRLRGKRLVYTPELPVNGTLNERRLKTITGGEEKLTARPIYGKPVTFKNTAKVVILTNNLPKLKSADNSIDRRFINMEFTQKFLTKQKYDEEARKNPRFAEDQPNVKLADATLHQRLLQSEKEGILAWIVSGAVRFFAKLAENTGVEVPEKLRIDSREFIEEQDTVKRFLDEECESVSLHDKHSLKECNGIKSSLLFGAYRDWANFHGLTNKAWSSIAFGREMGRLIRNGYPGLSKFDGRQYTYYSVKLSGNFEVNHHR